MFISLFLKRHLITILQKTRFNPQPLTLPSCPPGRYIKAKAQRGMATSAVGWGRERNTTPLLQDPFRMASPSCSQSHPASRSRLSPPC